VSKPKGEIPKQLEGKDEGPEISNKCFRHVKALEDPFPGSPLPF
jgi:hypothetical protein